MFTSTKMARHWPPIKRDSTNHGGYSLIELIAVLTLIGMLAAIGIGAVQPAYQRAVRWHWANRVERFDQAARRQARRMNRPILIRFSERRLECVSEPMTLSANSNDSREWPSAAGLSGSSLTLPPSVQLSASPSDVRVDTDGRSPDYSISITAAGKTITLRFLGQSGQMRIDRPDKESNWQQGVGR